MYIFLFLVQWVYLLCEVLWVKKEFLVGWVFGMVWQQMLLLLLLRQWLYLFMFLRFLVVYILFRLQVCLLFYCKGGVMWKFIFRFKFDIIMMGVWKWLVRLKQFVVILKYLVGVLGKSRMCLVLLCEVQVFDSKFVCWVWVGIFVDGFFCCILISIIGIFVKYVRLINLFISDMFGLFVVVKECVLFQLVLMIIFMVVSLFFV